MTVPTILTMSSNLLNLCVLSFISCAKWVNNKNMVYETEWWTIGWHKNRLWWFNLLCQDIEMYRHTNTRVAAIQFWGSNSAYSHPYIVRSLVYQAYKSVFWVWILICEYWYICFIFSRFAYWMLSCLCFTHSV